MGIQYYRKKIGFSGSGGVILPEPDLPEKIGFVK